MRTLKIDSLPNEKYWVDRDHLMLHACFQILKDCVEKENVDDHCDYESNKDFVDEVRFLYKWWIDRNDDTMDDDTMDDDTMDDDTMDDEMLIRLMKIRSQLWT